MIDPHALDERADQRGAELRMRDRRVGKGRAELGVDIGDAELLGDFARSEAHWMRPVCSKSAHALSGNSRNARSAE